jgi:hypothetical protein
VLGLLLAGCADNSHDRYVPAPDRARAALEAALRGWQSGQPPGPVEGASPPIQVVDSHRQPGQLLRSFTVLGEAPGDGPRCFAVRLVLDEPAEERRARFVVVGIDPLWVFRYEDYEMMAHWQCVMTDDPVGGKAAKNKSGGQEAPAEERVPPESAARPAGRGRR